MRTVVRPDSSSNTTTLFRFMAWIAWLTVGAVMFGLPELVGTKGAVSAAFEAASVQGKASVVAWVLGSVVLLARALMSLQQSGQTIPTADRSTGGGPSA
jgi:hypothetical protein